MRLGIIGGNGQLGSEIAEHAIAAGHDVVRFTHSEEDETHIEVTDKYLVVDQLIRYKPDVVINTAAFHNVEHCEREPDVAFLVNTKGAKYVARACKKIGAFCVYVSTDYVFGWRPPLVEDVYSTVDQPAPMNAYGWTKMLGEQLTRIEAGWENSAIVRVSYLFGKHACKQKGGNLVDKIVRRLSKGEKLTFFDDVVVSPTYAADAAKSILKIGRPGVYHAVNSGWCNLQDFAQAVTDLAGFKATIWGKSFQMEPYEILRPRNSALEPSSAVIGIQRIWVLALEAYLKEVGHSNGQEKAEQGRVAAEG